MGLIQSSVSVDPNLDAAFAEALQAIKSDMTDVLEEAANEVKAEAQRTSVFKDKTGMLRSKIRVEKSKFPDGGFIVTARSPHAHLVEFGHLLVKKTKGGLVKVIGHVTAHPFLRPALDRAKATIIVKAQAGG